MARNSPRNQSSQWWRRRESKAAEGITPSDPQSTSGAQLSVIEADFNAGDNSAKSVFAALEALRCQTVSYVSDALDRALSALDDGDVETAKSILIAVKETLKHEA